MTKPTRKENLWIDRHSWEGIDEDLESLFDIPSQIKQYSYAFNIVFNLHEDALCLKEKVQALESSIKEKDEMIEKMKCCSNCIYQYKIGFIKCNGCKNYSKWELKQRAE